MSTATDLPPRSESGAGDLTHFCAWLRQRIPGGARWSCSQLPYSLAILSGVLAGVSGPPSGFSFLTWIAFTPLLLVAVGTERLRTALASAYLAMLCLHLIVVSWLLAADDTYLLVSGAVFLLVGPLFHVLPYGALYIARRRYGAGVALAAYPILLTATEQLSTIGDLATPVVLLGHSQVENLPVLQLASVLGVHGISFWCAASNAIAAGSIRTLALTRPGRVGRTLLASVAVLGLWFALPHAAGYWLLQNVPQESQTGSLTVDIVQPHIEPRRKWTTNPKTQAESLLDLTRQAPSAPADLVVWPETSIPAYFSLAENAPIRQLIEDHVQQSGTPLLLGGTEWVFFENEHAPPLSKVTSDGKAYDIFNSAILLHPDRDTFQTYHKIALIPFAERIPFAEHLSGLDLGALRWNFGTGGYGRGTDTTLFTLAEKKGAPFSTVICFESLFGRLVRAMVRKGATFIVIITNDSWWGDSPMMRQHLQIAQVRAVENRRWVVRCANGGISAVIDPSGAVVTRTEPLTRTVLRASISPSTSLSIYARFGHFLEWVPPVLSLAFLLALWTGRQRPPRT